MNHILDGRILATKEELLRWHTAEVRAVLDSVKEVMDGMIDDLDTDNYFLSVIDAELQKLQEEER